MEEYGTTPQHPLRDLAARDCRGLATPEEATFLRLPENIPAWKEALRELNTDLETQFMERKADAGEFQSRCWAAGHDGKEEWFEYKNDYERWKATARRFKRSVEMKVAEAKRLEREGRAKSEDKRYIELLRETLLDCEAFLARDDNVAYSAIPARDELHTIVKTALNPHRD